MPSILPLGLGGSASESAAMATVSRATLIREVIKDLYPTTLLEFAPLANADTTTTTVAATALRSATRPAGTYKGAWFYIYDGTSSYDHRLVAEYAPTAAATYGKLTLDRALTSTPDTTSGCLLYAGALTIEDVRRLINKALRKLQRPRALPLTLISDGLMEETGTTSYSASNAALSKVTTSTNVAEGARCLLVDNTAQAGYAQTGSLSVIEQEQLLCEAVARVGNTSGTHTATLRVWDVTNGAEIGTAVETVNRERTRLRQSFTVPSGCRQVAFRLEGSAADTDVYWDEVVCWRPLQRQFDLPSDITRAEQVVDVYERRNLGGSSSGEDNTYDAKRAGFVRLPSWSLLANLDGATPFVLDLSASTYSQNGAIVVDSLLPFAELSADSDTTNARLDDVVARVRAYAYEQLSRVGLRDDREFYAKESEKQRRLQLGMGAHQPRPAVPIGARRRRGN